jgi:hypothetical protein
VSEFKDGCTGKPYIYHVDGCLFKAATEEEAIQKRNEWIYSDEAKILIQNKADEDGECNCPAYDSCDISIDSDVYIKASINSGQIYAEVFHKISNVSCNPGGCGSFEFNMSMQRDGTSDMVEYGRIPYSCGETTDKFIREESYVDGYYIYPVSMRLPDEYTGDPTTNPNYYGDLSYTVRTYSSHDDISSVSGGSHEINLRVQDVFDNGPDYIYRE